MTIKTLNRRLLPLLFITLLTLSGCIVTERQIETEQSLGELRTLASKLKVESKSLKVASEDNTRVLAEISADMDTLQQDFAAIRGGFETRENSLQRVEANFDLLSDAISAIDERMKDIDIIKKRLASVESPLRDGENKTDLDNALLGLRLSIEEIKKAAIEYELKEKQIEKAGEKTVAPKEEKKAETKGPDPKNLYLEGLEAIKVNRDHVKGLETLRLFLKLYNDHELADNAQYWIGEAHYDRGEWDRAAIEFNRVVKNYPKADKVPAALLKQAFSFEKMDDKETSLMILEKLIKDYPKSSEAKEAKKHLNKDQSKQDKKKKPAAKKPEAKKPAPAKATPKESAPEKSTTDTDSATDKTETKKQ